MSTRCILFSLSILIIALVLIFALGGETDVARAYPPPPAATPADASPAFANWLPLTLLPQWAYSGQQIPFWHPYSRAREDAMMRMANEFNTSNAWQVSIEPQFQGSYGEIYQKMLAAIASGGLPGLVVAYQNQAAAYQLSNALVDINTYVNDPEWGLSQEALDDYFPAILQADISQQFGGMRMGFPMGRSIEVLYYNADWLQEMGYDGPPTTWDQLREMACKAVQQSFSGGPAGEPSLGYEISTDASRFASMVFSRGGDLINADMNAYTLNTSQSREAMTFMQKLYQDGCAGMITERYGDQIDFGQGKLLFTIGSSSGLPYYKTAVAVGADFHWSVAALPHTTPDPVVNIYGASVSMPKTTTEEQLAAWTFLKWFTQPEQQAAWAKATNYFPVRKSAADELGDYFAENPAYATAFALLPYGKSEPPVACYDRVRAMISATYESILGGADVESALALLETDANATLADCRQ